MNRFRFLAVFEYKLYIPVQYFQIMNFGYFACSRWYLFHFVLCEEQI